MLVDIPLDLQIVICVLLRPSDILALRKTCKALQLATRQRVVWVAALHQVCIDNTLFLPSFPIPEMSDAELEQAAIAPCRWIELCAAVEKQHPRDDSCAKLYPRSTRIIENPLPKTDLPLAVTDFIFVPGGRYIVAYSPHGICVWDLGYTSSTACKPIASVGPEGGSYGCTVSATSDGTGLIIISFRPYEYCLVYEIYPQSKTPQLTQIAHLDFDPHKDPPVYLLPDRMVWYGFYEDRIVFIVWDYRLNHSMSFSAYIDVEKFEYNLKVIATNTAIIVISKEEILVWANPPLSPGPPDFSDHNPAHIPPLFNIKYPDGIESDVEILEWNTISPWYFGSSQPLYFDMLCTNQEHSTIHRFEITIKPDLSAAALHVINIAEPIPSIIDDDSTFQSYSICEGTLFSCWIRNDPTNPSSYMANIISMPHSSPTAKMLLPTRATTEPLYDLAALCPTSGRYVYFHRGDINKLVVMDFVQ